ncbi:MAG: type VII secretion-associated serine protease mycosin [Rhodococcus sp.]|nr:type VII secretion-associated serine protease mycosin [Rhodococcus sp. (in: high G+C Gram-positive bacteria)]
MAAEPPPNNPSMVPPADTTAIERKNNIPCNGAATASDGPEVPVSQQFLDFRSAWRFTRGEGQKVAVIDTGVAHHPRLPNLIGGGDLVGGSDGTEDCDIHGTLVAGLIAAQPAPGSGFAGGAPGAEILSIRQSSTKYGPAGRTPVDPEKAANSEGAGNVVTLAQAIRDAADQGASVINISEVACRTAGAGMGDYDKYLGAAVNYAVTVQDAVVVAAAGNVGSGGCDTQNPYLDPLNPAGDTSDSVFTLASPAWHDDYVLTVGRVNADGTPSEESLRGPWVDVAAPGTDLVSLKPGSDDLTKAVTDGRTGQPNPVSGTSFAAPFVSATAALVRARFPELSALEVMARIEATAHSPAEGWNPVVGHGVVDPLAAVTAKIPREGVAADAPKSVSIAAPTPPETPDPRPRTVALASVGTLAALLVLGVLGSFPLRRRLQAMADNRTD